MTKNILERYQATLIGCAVGDTLGIPVETWTKEDIEKYYGKVTVPIKSRYVRVGGFMTGKIFPVAEVPKEKLRYIFGLGEYSDDTILTLALAESLVNKKGYDLEDIAKKQVHEYTSRVLPDGKLIGGFGKTTINAFKNILNGVSPKESATVGPGSGPAMKMSPIGLYAHAINNPATLNKAIEVSEITHNDTRSVVGGLIQAHAINYLLGENLSRKEFISNLVEIARVNENQPSGEMVAPEQTIYKKLLWIEKNMDASDVEAVNYIKNGGAAWECHPFALFMFQKYWDKPIDGLVETVNWGGDADTSGAIYGALCGAKNGMIFPKEFYEPLGEKELTKISNLGKELFEISSGR